MKLLWSVAERWLLAGAGCGPHFVPVKPESYLLAMTLS
jgi:hypothetical protein